MLSVSLYVCKCGRCLCGYTGRNWKGELFSQFPPLPITRTGASFKAGGSLAGFLISFGALFYAYRSMGGTALMFKVTVVPKQRRFNRTGSTFTAKITVLKRKSGRKSEHNADAIWEAGGLTVHLRNVEEDDMVMIALFDGASGRWESDFFDPLCQSLTLN